MMPSPDRWLQWAAYIMPKEKQNWLVSMMTECEQLSNPVERQLFAIGCFKVALLEWARTRKGLNYIARASSAFLLMAGCCVGVHVVTKTNAWSDAMYISKIIIGLCVFYMVGSALILISIKGLKIYAAAGFSAAMMGFGYCHLVSSGLEGLPTDYLAALFLEAAGLMVGLFFAAVYFNLLYSPGVDDAQ